ncbi:MAG TPA: glycine cleavage T C-terminal barrel domain-containing protein [Acidobacteriota bacterium]|nr:glycine cleavage T C-terminal barrel domain-containing protein [Acidobacteriota bacterium]
MDLDAYQAARESVALIDLRSRGKIRATGPDRVSFLHSMASNDVEKLAELAGRFNTFLTMKGKIVSTFYLYKFPQHLLLDLDGQLTAKTIETLNQFIIMDEVELEDVSSDWAHFSLQGPACDEAAHSLLGTAAPEQPLHLAQGRFADDPAWVVRKADLGPQGCEVVLPRDQGDDFLSEALKLEGVRQADAEAVEALRIEASLPRHGAELDESRYPMEARLTEALDFDKGCYIGQEVVAKATYIGGVARLLCSLALEGQEVPERGTKLVNVDGRAAGRITSAVLSPRLGHPIALAYLKKAYIEPGTSLRAVLGEDRHSPAQVVKSF